MHAEFLGSTCYRPSMLWKLCALASLYFSVIVFAFPFAASPLLRVSNLVPNIFLCMYFYRSAFDHRLNAYPPGLSMNSTCAFPRNS